MRSFICLLLCFCSVYCYRGDVILYPKEETIISSQVSSVVLNVNKNMGDSFNKGDVLVSLDNYMFNAILNKSKTMYERAKEKFEIMNGFFKDGSASNLELAEAKAELFAAEAEMVIAAKKYENCTISAPYDGKVKSVFLNEYETVQPLTPIIEIVNDNVVIGKFFLSKEFLSKVFVGKKLKMVFDGNNIEAYVSNIDPVVDPVSGLFQVFAEIDNKNGVLTSGLSGEFEIE